MLARETVLATGGLGRLFLHTTNPPGGAATAWPWQPARACASSTCSSCSSIHGAVALEWPLLAVRGAARGGARLIDSRGNGFMQKVHPDGSLAPRDVVARGIHKMMLDMGEPSAFLDISHKPADWVRSHFPASTQNVRSSGSTSRASRFRWSRRRTIRVAASPSTSGAAEHAPTARGG